MREYTIYIKWRFTVRVVADDFQYFKDDNSISFYKDGERVAKFYLDNICGWSERSI